MTEEFRTSRQATADYLDAVADWFEGHRWMRHKFSNKTMTQACALGAMRIVAGAKTPNEAEGYIHRDTAIDAAKFIDGRVAFSRCLAKRDDSIVHGGFIPGWNDQEGMTKRKVIKAFRDCAKALRAGGENDG